MSEELDRGLAERSAERRKHIVFNRAKNFEEAEDWDLKFWLDQTPAMRLSAIVAMHREAEMIQRSKKRPTPILDDED